MRREKLTLVGGVNRELPESARMRREKLTLVGGVNRELPESARMRRAAIPTIIMKQFTVRIIKL